MSFQVHDVTSKHAVASCWLRQLKDWSAHSLRNLQWHGASHMLTTPMAAACMQTRHRIQYRQNVKGGPHQALQAWCTGSSCYPRRPMQARVEPLLH